MKRKASALVLLAVLGGGCVTTEKNDPKANQFNSVARGQDLNGFQGPWGEPVSPSAGMKPPVVNESGVRSASSKGDKSNVVAAVASAGDMKSGVKQVAGNGFGPRNGTEPVGPGVPGAVAAVGAMPSGPMPRFAAARTSVRFSGPNGMKVTWFAPQAGNASGFAPTQVEAPGRYNFPQGAIYRLKLSDLPNRAGIELYPTLEVVPTTMKTATFLAHSAVPVGFTDEDFEQVAAGNMVTKVIYLPDPQFQDLAAAGPDEVVSSRLEPGVDPVAEAQRRGSVLLVIRLGNIDLEAPNTPGLDSAPNSVPMPGGMPGMRGAPMPPQGGMPMQGMQGAPMPPMGNGMLPGNKSSFVPPNR